jgi:hypothetical protein
VEILKRSRTSEVFIESSELFCWVTIDEAMLSLKRCKLNAAEKRSSQLSTLGSSETREEAEKESDDGDSPHDLLLERPFGDEPIDVYDLLLAQPMRPIHRLQILHGVPVVLHKDDRIRPRQIQPEPSDLGRQQQHVDARIGIERLDDAVSFGGVGRPIETHVREGGEMAGEEVGLDDVEHGLELAEDEDSMLGRGGEGEGVGFGGSGRAGARRGGFGVADAAVEEDLPKRRRERVSFCLESRGTGGETPKERNAYLRASSFGALTRSLSVSPPVPPDLWIAPWIAG